MPVRRKIETLKKTGEQVERWMVDVKIPGYPRVRKHSPMATEKGAKAYEKKLIQQILNGEFDEDRKKGEALFKDVSKEYQELHSNINNKESGKKTLEVILRVHLLPFFGTMKVQNIDAKEVERFKADRIAYRRKNGFKLKNKTINTFLIHLKAICNWAKDIGGYIDVVPRIKMLKAEKPKFDFLDFEEKERLLEEAKNHGVQWHSMLVVALNTGMRLGELLGLQWDDIDIKARKVIVERNNWNGHIDIPKGGKSRWIGLNKSAVEALKKQKENSPSVFKDKDRWVWCQENCQPLKKEILERALRRIRKKAGLRNIGFHCLRHTTASHMVMRGVPLKAVQEILGHASIVTTMVYSHLTPDARFDAVNVLDERFQGTGKAPLDLQVDNVLKPQKV